MKEKTLRLKFNLSTSGSSPPPHLSGASSSDFGAGQILKIPEEEALGTIPGSHKAALGT